MQQRDPPATAGLLQQVPLPPALLHVPVMPSQHAPQHTRERTCGDSPTAASAAGAGPAASLLPM